MPQRTTIGVERVMANRHTSSFKLLIYRKPSSRILNRKWLSSRLNYSFSRQEAPQLATRRQDSTRCAEPSQKSAMWKLVPTAGDALNGLHSVQANTAHTLVDAIIADELITLIKAHRHKLATRVNGDNAATH